jgi:hypothetical protein
MGVPVGVGTGVGVGVGAGVRAANVPQRVPTRMDSGSFVRRVCVVVRIKVAVILPALDVLMALDRTRVPKEAQLPRRRETVYMVLARKLFAAMPRRVDVPMTTVAEP